METVRKLLNNIPGNLGDVLDMPPMDEPIPELGLTLDEALSAFSGDLAASLIDLPAQDAPPGPAREVPGFVLALGTVDPASKVYQKILKNKLLALFDQNARDPLQAMGISLVAKDNRLILGSHGQAELLKSGKASNPIGGESRELLADGYMNLVLDFDKLSEALPINRQDLDDEEEIALLGLDLLDNFSFRVTEEDGFYEVTFALSLKDKETNFFNQLATFIGNALDPAWRDPEIGPRIDTARKLALEKPDHFRGALLGSWKSKWTNEEDEEVYGVSRWTSKEDGTYSIESLNVYKEGYERKEHGGTWKLVGNSLVVHDEKGLVEWVGGMLSASDEKLEYYVLFNSNVVYVT
jgi:hypothetical protein